MCLELTISLIIKLQRLQALRKSRLERILQKQGFVLVKVVNAKLRFRNPPAHGQISSIECSSNIQKLSASDV